MANENVTPDELLLADALASYNKTANRVSSKTLLSAIVEFLNGDAATYKHFEQKYNVPVSRLRTLIKSNDAISGKVWPVENEQFGVCLVRIPQ